MKSLYVDLTDKAKPKVVYRGEFTRKDLDLCHRIALRELPKHIKKLKEIANASTKSR